MSGYMLAIGQDVLTHAFGHCAISGSRFGMGRQAVELSTGV